jgi:hypothetical protein
MHHKRLEIVAKGDGSCQTRRGASHASTHAGRTVTWLMAERHKRARDHGGMKASGGGAS